jgi:hypothetical protein
MANEVFANNREIACKSGSGITTAEFPDVCFTPPQTPATPPGVPVPYPNTARSGDGTEGSRNVLISDKEVLLKDTSFLKTSIGDEAGCAPKKGIVTSTTKGKAYFISWSMDVRAEGENLVRHMDRTTNNHGSKRKTGAMPQLHIDTLAISQAKRAECEKKKQAYEKECTPIDPEKDCTKSCLDQQKCQMVAKEDDKEKCCKGHNTGDHIVEAAGFANLRPEGSNLRAPGFAWIKGCEKYKAAKAPCVCVSGTSWHSKEHGIASCLRYTQMLKLPAGALPMVTPGGAAAPAMQAAHVTTYGQAKLDAADALVAAFPDSKCDRECILAQFEDFDKACGLKNDQKIRAVPNISSQSGIAERMAKIEARTGLPAVSRLTNFITSTVKTAANR